MKKFLLFFLVAALPTVVFGQKNPSWRKTDDQWAKKNSITATATALILSNTSYYGLGYCLGIEYDRMIAYNLSLSAIAAYPQVT